VETGCHHAYDLRVVAIQTHRLAKDGRIGCEEFTPYVVTNDSDEIATLLCVVAGQVAAQQGLHSDHLKEVRGNAIAFDSSRAGVSAQVEIAEAERGDVSERSHLRAKVEKIGWGYGILAGLIRIDFPQEHQAIQLRKWIRPKEKRTHGTENGSVGTDTKGKSKDRGECKAWRLDESPETVTQLW